MFNPEALTLLQTAGREHNVDWRRLAAFVETESAGRAFATINGERMPLIRWEGHYFHRLLAGQPAKQQRAVKSGLASPKAGRVKNPTNQLNRYKLLDRAKAVDENAAICSCSWGVGQVMGAHWKRLGYTSPRHFEEEVTSGVAGQIRVMIQFMLVYKVMEKLRVNDMDGAFQIYNGRSFRKWGYPEMYARAWAKWSKHPETPPPVPTPRPLATPEAEEDVSELLDSLDKNSGRSTTQISNMVGQGVGACSSVGGIIGYIESPLVQAVFIVALVVIAIAALWIMRERSKKAQWAHKLRERYQIWA